MLESKDWFIEICALILDNPRTTSTRQDIHVLNHLLSMHKLVHSLLSSVDDEGEEEAEEAAL